MSVSAETAIQGAAEPTGRPGRSISGEYLTFTLGEEEFGVDILKVQEIRGYDTVTRIPDSPHFIKGVINLRGTIVPVIDMRLKLNLERADYSDLTVMIVLNLGERVVGMVVDGVSDVIALGSEQIRPPPEFDGQFDTQYITGIGALEQRMLILIDIDRLISGGALSAIPPQTH